MRGPENDFVDKKSEHGQAFIYKPNTVGWKQEECWSILASSLAQVIERPCPKGIRL